MFERSTAGKSARNPAHRCPAGLRTSSNRKPTQSQMSPASPDFSFGLNIVPLAGSACRQAAACAPTYLPKGALQNG